MKVDDGNWTPQRSPWTFRNLLGEARLEHALILGLSLAVAVLTGALMVG